MSDLTTDECAKLRAACEAFEELKGREFVPWPDHDWDLASREFAALLKPSTVLALLDMANRALDEDLLELVADIWRLEAAGAYAGQPEVKNMTVLSIGNLVTLRLRDRALAKRAADRGDDPVAGPVE